MKNVCRILLAAALVATAACNSKKAEAPKIPESGELPPGHPSIDGAGNGELPPGHPDMNAGNGEMPKGHPPIKAPDSKELLAQVEAMKAQLKDKPKSFEICSALGNLYYDNAKYPDAIDNYRQALEKAQDVLALNAELGAVTKDDAKTTLESAVCDKASTKEWEGVVAKAKEHKEKKELSAARVCTAEAMKPVVTVLSRRANSFFLIGNPDQAVTEHEKALKHAPDSEDSLFFIGAILYDAHGDEVEKLKRADEVWKHFLEVTPKENPRHEVVEKMLPDLEKAIAAGGVSKLPKPQMAGADDPHAGMGQDGQGPGLPPVDPSVAEAIANTPKGPEMDAALQKSIEEGEEALAKGDGQTAAARYRSVVPFAPDNMRAVAGMAASQFLKGSSVADRVFSQAARDPKAVDELAERLKAKGNPTLAKTLWKKLAEAAPDYAQQANLAKKLE